MGYETRLIVGVGHEREELYSWEKAREEKREFQRWLQVIANFEFGKIAYDSEFALWRDRIHRDKKSEPENFFFYERSEGNTPIYVDSYGEDLLPLDIEKTLELLTEDWNQGKTKNPVVPAFLAALSTLMKVKSEYYRNKEIVLVHYGY